MARRSPQTERIIGLINLLTVDDTGDGVTISELARRLAISKATCYPMLEALTEAGFLTRHPTRKTFHLGPAVIAAGAAAARHDPRRARAREAVVALGDELNLTCWLCGLDGNHVRVVDQAWHSPTITPIMRVGERFPLRPPVGAVFMAWSADRRIARWLDDGGVPTEQRPAYLERLARVREEGSVVSLEATPYDELRTVVTQLAGATTPAERSRLMGMITARENHGAAAIAPDLEPDTEYSIQSIEAPIFDDTGEVTLAIGLTNLPRLTGRRAGELEQAVRAAAATVNEPHTWPTATGPWN